MENIRVLIVDDHTVVRGGLRLFLLAFSDLELVGEASSGQMAVELSKIHEPDVIIMDLLMPGMNGVEATHQILSRNPHTKVIALTSFPDNQLMKDAIDAGVSGFLLKTASATDLVEAIRAVANNKIAFSAEAKKIIDEESDYSLFHKSLTKREWEVFRQLTKGSSNAEIAEDLGISVATVKYHISHILSKLNLKNRVEVITYAIHHHLMD